MVLASDDIVDNDSNEKSVYIVCHCFTFILKPLGPIGHIYISINQKIYEVLRSEYIQTISKTFHAIYSAFYSWTILTHSHVAFISHSTTLPPSFTNPVPTAPFLYCLYVSGLVSDKRSPNQYHWTYSWHACLTLKRRPYCAENVYNETGDSAKG